MMSYVKWPNFARIVALSQYLFIDGSSEWFHEVEDEGCFYREPFFRLHSRQSTWRFLALVAPPLRRGMI
jgi:hypothetical protein